MRRKIIRDEGGRQSMSALRGACIRELVLERKSRSTVIWALDRHGRKLFGVNPYNLYDGQGMLFTSDDLKELG